MSYVLAFVASCLYIFLKATQQLSVVNFLYARIVPTSMAMAACEVFIMVNVARTADDLVGLVVLALSIGVGAGLGCLAAMKLHQRRNIERHQP
jgi:hypothetical protein